MGLANRDKRTPLMYKYQNRNDKIERAFEMNPFLFPYLDVVVVFHLGKVKKDQIHTNVKFVEGNT